MTEPGSMVRTEMDADRVLTVWIDVPGRPVNTLSAAVWDGLDAAVRRIEEEQPTGVVIASAKPRSFVAGADLFELRAMSDAELDAHLAHGQKILDRLAAVPVTTVAAINGDALGGGLELALACRLRVTADDPRSRLGLPETTLGLVPGWGGTTRLPRLIGLERALAMMLPGKAVPPREALTLGLVDRVVPRDTVVTTAKALAGGAVAGRDVVMEDADTCRQVCERFRQTTRDRSGDHLPAPLRLIDIVAISYGSGLQAAAVAERRGLVEMRNTPAGRNLLRLFFLRTAAKKTAAAQVAGTPRTVRTVVVLGGGTMGAGIAGGLAAAGMDVHVVEADPTAAAAAAMRLATAGNAAVPVSTDWSAVTVADLVVEAVVEDLEVKRDVFRHLGEHARPDAVLATNTSSLSVAAIAAATSHPDRVIGLHFFNPVPRMPLVEVVAPPEAAADAVATGVAVAVAAGKTPIVCRDAPGFVVNRVLFPSLHVALMAAERGADLPQVDAAARAWGMPLGPYALMDEIGLDVTLLVFRSLERSLGGRLTPPPWLHRMVERGWLGRKSGRGFYAHADGAIAANAQLQELYGAAPAKSAGGPAPQMTAGIVEAMVTAMSAEATRVLEERVVTTADAVDLATVLGIGFPGFRGGLATFAGLRAMTEGA